VCNTASCPCRRTPRLALEGTTECCAVTPFAPAEQHEQKFVLRHQGFQRGHEYRCISAVERQRLPRDIANSLLHVQPRKYIDVHPVDSLDGQPLRSEPQEFLTSLDLS
jgi:hypothetical protein